MDDYMGVYIFVFFVAMFILFFIMFLIFIENSGNPFGPILPIYNKTRINGN